MKILEVVSSERNSGPGAAATIECRALAACGHEVRMLAAPGGTIERACEEAGVAFLPLPGVRKAGPLLGLSRIVSALSRALKESPPDVIHVHRTPEHIAALFVLRRRHAGRTLVRSLHRPPFSRAPLLAGLALRGADALILPCAEYLDALRSRIHALPKATAILPGGVDVDAFRPDRRSNALRRELGAENDDVPLIGLVSRFKRYRRIEAYIEAMAGLPRDIPWAAVCLGRGEREAELAGRIRELGLGERMRVVDPRDRFHETVASLDIGVALDPGSDGSSRAALEMFASGVAVAGFDRDAIGDILMDRECAAAVPDGSVERLRAAILELVRDPTRRRSMGRAARDRACRDFSLRSLGTKLAELYAQAGASHGG